MAVGRKQVAPRQTIASQWGNEVWDQSVNTFADAAQRTTQWPTPNLGAISYLESTGTHERWDGATWLPLTGISRMLLNAAPIVGAWPSSAPLQMAGASMVVTSSGQFATVPMGPFPNGVFTVVAVNGDAGVQVIVTPGTVRVSSFDVGIRNYGGGIPGPGPIRISYVAIGY